MAKKKNKKEKEVEVIDDLDMVKAVIDKKYGGKNKNIFTTMAERDKSIHVETVSTGSIALDVALGRGGVAKSRIYEFFGPNSSGKTTLAISIIAQAQKIGLTCCFVDLEHTADPKLFKSLGVDTDKLFMIENLFDAEDYLEAMELAIKSGVVDVVVLDSITALVPRAELEADLDQDFYALQARLMSRCLRNINPYINDSNVLMIFINQIRSKMTSYGNPETTSGGNALLFYATGRIRVSGGKGTSITDDSGVAIGHRVKFEIVKNKLAPPFKSTEINLLYGYGYDNYTEVLQLAVDFGIADLKGSWYSYNDIKLGQGAMNARETLINDLELYNKIRGAVTEILIPVKDE